MYPFPVSAQGPLILTRVWGCLVWLKPISFLDGKWVEAYLGELCIDSRSGVQSQLSQWPQVKVLQFLLSQEREVVEV